MARQPLTLAPLLVLVLAACEDDEVFEGAFEMPSAVAVLQPEAGGPFEQPVGFVANGIGGQIAPLDLKYGRFLTDDPTASFLRTNWLPTGGARLLGAVAAWAPSEDEVTVFAADRAFSTLLRVPYVVGVDDRGFPIEGFPFDGEIRSEPLVTDVRAFVAGDARLENIELKTGYSATETWTVEYVPSQDAWLVTGSRSGLQAERAVAGARFVGDRRRIAFTIEGQGEAGDRFEIDTENGVREIDVGGLPFEMRTAPDQSVIAMSVSTGDDASELRLFDPASESATVVALAEGAEPGRLAWSADGFDLLVADGARPALWEVTDGAAVEHVMPWPTIDVAPLYGLEFGRLAYVVPIDGQEVWLYDLDARTFLDVNAAAPGVQPMSFRSPVLGVEAIPLEHLFRDETDDGIRRSGRSVAVSLHEGGVVFMEEGTGCLLQDELGPRTDIAGTLGAQLDYDTNFDNVVLAPFLERNITNDRHVIVNPCAGVAQPEVWTLTFDRNLAAWVVEASADGVQELLAFEDERYLSDEGEVSFVIRAGSIPSRDGWEITFTVLDGVLRANGDNDRDGIPEVPLEVPGDPVFFHYRVGPVDGSWQQVDQRAFVLVPGQASDVVGRVDPQEGDVEIRWD